MNRFNRFVQRIGLTRAANELRRQGYTSVADELDRQRRELGQ